MNLVIWSESAESTFESIICFIRELFGERQVEQFIRRTRTVIQIVNTTRNVSTWSKWTFKKRIYQ